MPAVAHELAAVLRAAGSVYAEEEAELLLAEAADRPELDRMVSRRASGEPIELVVGWAAFCGLRVRVDQGVFVPRLRTELLAELAVAELADEGVLLDLCCGAGAVAVVARTRRPRATVHAADVSPEAVACARRHLDVPVHHGDLFDALPSALAGRVDVLAVNAPYVPTGELHLMPREARLHEPWVSLDGGDDGVEVHRRVARGAAPWLSAQGVVLIETSRRQEDLTARALQEVGFEAVAIYDDARDATVVVARRG